jgi:hypothetical protein
MNLQIRSLYIFEVENTANFIKNHRKNLEKNKEGTQV